MADLPERIDKLASSLEQLEVDAILVTNEINVRYLSGFTGDSSYLLVTSGSASILSDGRYDAQIASECAGLASVIRSPHQSLGDLTKTVVNDLGAKRVAIEADQLTLGSYRFLADQCAGIELVETSGVVEKQRMIKDAGEIEITRQAVRIAERAFESLIPMITCESSERAMAHELEAKMRFLGAEGCSFAPIVAVGPSGALPHYSPRDISLGDATTLLIDWGAKFRGYASDLTRTLHRESASTAFRRAYDAVLASQMAAIDAIRPGVAVRDVDAVARAVLDQAGMGDAFKHGLGHGTGLEIHESPRMSSISDETLVSGMIITVEPGVYFDRDFGIRIEDDVLVTDAGCEVLSHLPKGLDDCRMML